MKVSTLNKATGEQIEFNADTTEEIFTAYRAAQEYSKVADDLKNQLKKLLPAILDEQGRSQISEDGYQFKQYETQRMNYNIQSLREVFDEDTVNLFLKPQKGLVDSYLKENQLESDQLILLKQGLEADGKITKAVRLEKVI